MANGIQSDRSITPVLPNFTDPTMFYYHNGYPSPAYYYSGVDANDWEDYTKYVNPDGVEMTPPLTPSSGPYPTPAATTKGETKATDQAPLLVDSTNTKSNGIANSGVAKGNAAKPTYQNSSYNANGSYGKGISASGYQDLRFGFDGLLSPIPCIPSSRNQDFRPHLMGLHHPRPMSGMNTASGYMHKMYPNKFYGQYGNAYRSGLGYGPNGYDTRRGWMTVDNKYKPMGKENGFYSYGNENMDDLNELNRGPRAKSTKTQKSFTPVALAVKWQNIPFTVTTENEKEKSSVTPNLEQYNYPDFPETYPDAKFFIIKSYNEDDVHKSIKYNVWASTPNGNKKVDVAYQDAQQKLGSCPIFLFFSVNTSGQFVGVAEMAGLVDFNKNVEYWQQDKWIGCFPVKCHIVKAVPNSHLKHIILENNENKPVTNNRDTQEVKLEQGLQKKIQKKKAKQLQFQKQAQIWEGKPTEEKTKESKESANGDLKSSEVESDLTKEVASLVLSNGDSKTLKVAAVSEKKLVSNGVANGH
ncbi:hypothetical protein BUALT_Bualt02G0016500 [Buddleja alternifolia]|uniref:YTH domain-containing family protein n=1 Tax=Buddleja alternifolia TaxID=168488 RepID=A0AAV6Y540_9LAMI|nr:hypothetical protein BUALT_Bualt02G0016500 [Buddleja alternifolia]